MSSRSFRAYLRQREMELVSAGYEYCAGCGRWIKSSAQDRPAAVVAFPRRAADPGLANQAICKSA
jgi:hypothetical protein